MLWPGLDREEPPYPDQQIVINAMAGIPTDSQTLQGHWQGR